ncbi:MAG: dihydroorotate dehydrogenase [Fretibacterium sp.]|nr:dihydroorotate dehydrogenase [Fretibacterium sp.]
MSVIRDYQAPLAAKEEVSPGIWHLTLECPPIAREARPGNFVLIKVSGGTAPLLRRPLGVLEADAERGTFDVLFRVVGEGTELLSETASGQTLSVRGPVGGQFGPFRHKEVWAVAGTLGVVPLLFLRQSLGAFGRMFLGVGSAEWRPFTEWVASRAPEMELFSDDGSIGKKGFAIDGLKGQSLAEVSLAVCGPNPMMKALYGQYGTLCDDIQVSLERRMGCGMGGCFGCVVDTETGRRRVCIDGPVFQAREVKWDELHL